MKAIACLLCGALLASGATAGNLSRGLNTDRFDINLLEVGACNGSARDATQVPVVKHRSSLAVYPYFGNSGPVEGYAYAQVSVGQGGEVQAVEIRDVRPQTSRLGAHLIDLLKRWTFVAGRPGTYCVESYYHFGGRPGPGEVPSEPPAPKAVTMGDAVYPDLPLAQDLEGTATMTVDIQDDGRPAYIYVVREMPGGLQFGSAAIATVATWTFPPGLAGRYQLKLTLRPQEAVSPR